MKYNGNTPFYPLPFYPRPFTLALLPRPFTLRLLTPSINSMFFFYIYTEGKRAFQFVSALFYPTAFLPPLLKYHFQSYRYGIFNVHLNIIIGLSDMTHNLTLP